MKMSVTVFFKSIFPVFYEETAILKYLVFYWDTHSLPSLQH